MRNGELLLLLLAGALYTPSGVAQAPSTGAELTVAGDVERPLALTPDDLRQMPHKALQVTNAHEGKEETYQGVPLAELLKRAGVPQGTQLRGPAMATYVVAEGSDGYRVTFSIAELDSDFQDSEVIVADKLNQEALNDTLGPLRLVVPHDKRPARWVRMLKTLRVVRLPNQGAQ